MCVDTPTLGTTSDTIRPDDRLEPLLCGHFIREFLLQFKQCKTFPVYFTWCFLCHDCCLHYLLIWYQSQRHLSTLVYNPPIMSADDWEREKETTSFAKYQPDKVNNSFFMKLIRQNLSNLKDWVHDPEPFFFRRATSDESRGWIIGPEWCSWKGRREKK